MKKSNLLILLLILTLIISFIFPAAVLAVTSDSETVTEQTSSGTDSADSASENDEDSAEDQKDYNDDDIEVPNNTAKSILLTDMKSGRVLYSKKASTKSEPASLTKVMTVLLAVEAIQDGKVSLDDEVTASSDCQAGLDESSSTANILPGEKLTLEQLLYCAMVASANDACNIIAEYIGGTVDDFVAMMNDKAAEIGCTDTHFVNANGLPDDDHYTTANDLYLITKEALKYELFSTLCNTQSYTVPKTNKSDSRDLSNSNALISAESMYGNRYLYQYAKGVKTGHTSSAGFCLISTAEKDNIQLMCIVLGDTDSSNVDGSTSYNNFADTISFYDWAFSNYTYQTVYSVDTPITEVTVKFAPKDANSVLLVPEKDISVLLPLTFSDSDIEQKVTLYDETPTAPIAEGDELGNVEVFYKGISYGTTKLVASSAIEISSSEKFKAQLSKIFSNPLVIILFLIIILVLLVYVYLVARYRRIKKMKLQKKHAQQRKNIKKKEEAASSKIYGNSSSKMNYYDKDKQITRNQEKIDYFKDFFKDEGNQK